MHTYVTHVHLSMSSVVPVCLWCYPDLKRWPGGGRLWDPLILKKLKRNDQNGLVIYCFVSYLWVRHVIVWGHCLVLTWPRMLYMAALIHWGQRMPLKWYLVTYNWTLYCQNHHQLVSLSLSQYCFSMVTQRVILQPMATMLPPHLVSNVCIPLCSTLCSIVWWNVKNYSFCISLQQRMEALLLMLLLQRTQQLSQPMKHSCFIII